MRLVVGNIALMAVIALELYVLVEMVGGILVAIHD